MSTWIWVGSQGNLNPNQPFPPPAGAASNASRPPTRTSAGAPVLGNHNLASIGRDSVGQDSLIHGREYV